MIPEYGGNFENIAGIEGVVTVNISDVRDVHSLPSLVSDRDVIFSLAGQTSHLDSMVDPYTDLEINCRAQLSLLEACRLANPDARIVFASTRQIYGRPEYLPVDERHPIRPVDVNGINKTAGEWYHLLYGEMYGIPVCVLRLTNTYGPRMRIKDARQTFLGHWLRQIVTGEEIAVFGDGLQKRDFNYVDDAVDAFLLAATRDEALGKVYNLGDSEVVSLLDLAKKLVELYGGGSFRVVPFPEERKSDRHRRLLRRLRAHPSTISAGSRVSGSRTDSGVPSTSIASTGPRIGRDARPVPRSAASDRSAAA